MNYYSHVSQQPMVEDRNSNQKGEGSADVYLG